MIAAAAKFGDDFGKTPIKLSPYMSDDRDLPPIIKDNLSSVLTNLKISLRFLRCFGSKLSELSVGYGEAAVDTRNDYLNHYINRYCADTLTTIIFLGRLPVANDHFLEPFEKTEKVEIRCVYLQNHLSEFVNWFPNLRHLRVNTIFGIDKTAITAVAFPHLEYVSLSWNWFFRNEILQTEIVANLLRANRELKSVKINLTSDITLN